MKKKLWGGRFKKEMHPVLKKFSYSLRTDGQLFEAELRVNAAWAKMLAKARLLTASECTRILKALEGMKQKWNPEKTCLLAADYEDVHTFIQQELERITGSVGKKIHTGRSRNDLVVTSTLVYLKAKTLDLLEALPHLQKALVTLAEKAGALMIPGLTHLRKAQPILAAHHLLAYVEMLETDLERLQDARKRLDVLPLGSAAIAGSALSLDRKFLARELGFHRISENSMAATADRAFAAEILSVLSILWMHLSRLSEDMILWNHESLGFIELDDAFATGSSLMPQKKNPDVFELVRGRTGVIFGYLQAILTLQKGLPLAYNRDLQEDKPGLFDAIQKTETALGLLALTIESAKFQPVAMEKALADDSIFATDVLEYLIRKGMPFSDAHETVGKAVHFSQENGIGLSDFSMGDWKRFSSLFDKDVTRLFDPAGSVSAKKTIGSTQPAMVQMQIKKWKKRKG